MDFQSSSGGDCRWGDPRGLGTHHDGRRSCGTPTLLLRSWANTSAISMPAAGRGSCDAFQWLPPGGTGQPVRKFFLSRLGKAKSYISVHSYLRAAAFSGCRRYRRCRSASLNHSLACSFFVISRFQKQCCDLLKTLLLATEAKKVYLRVSGTARKCKSPGCFSVLGTSMFKLHNILPWFIAFTIYS